MSEIDKFWNLDIQPGKPIGLQELNSPDVPPEDSEAQNEADQVRTTLKAFLAKVQDLLSGKYSALKPIIPAYIADPGDVVAIRCNDGIVVRIDPKTGDRKTLVGRIPESLSEIVPKISEGVVHCHPNRDYTPTTGVTFQISVSTTTGEMRRDLGISFDFVLEKPESVPAGSHTPYCLVSVQNAWELLVFGEQFSPESQQTKPFIMRTRIRVGSVGWDCVQVYPFFRSDDWKPEYAALWAETELLRAVVVQQIRENRFHSLDPNAVARMQKRQLLSEYEELLNSNPQQEETLQRFLSKHPELLCPTYIRCFPKLALGAKVTDFVFREATGDYLLVELERSTLPLFLTGKRATDSTAELNHARSQIADWRRYVEDNLATVQKELGLTGISSNPRSLIVMGRSTMLTDDQRRKLATMENESPKTKILTYDDLLHSARAVFGNILGPLGRESGATRVYWPTASLGSNGGAS